MYGIGVENYNLPWKQELEGLVLEKFDSDPVIDKYDLNHDVGFCVLNTINLFVIVFVTKHTTI